MGCFKAFVHVILLLTIPSLALYPAADRPLITTTSPDKENLFSFDDLLNLLDKLETGELEKRCNPADVEHIAHFLTNLAIKGALPDESQYLALQQDIQELNACEYLFSFAEGYDIVFCKDEGEIILCRDWLNKKCDQTRKFAKSHKKAILIGAVIVTATAIVVFEVAAAFIATAVPEKEEKNQPAKENELQVPYLKAILDEQITSFKEQILEEELYSINFDAISLEKTIITLGKKFAHELLDEVAELAYGAPELNKEFKKIGSKLFP